MNMPSKAEVIRTAVLQNPKLGPTEIVRIVEGVLPGTKVRTQEVSTIKGEMRKKGTLPEGAAKPPAVVEQEVQREPVIAQATPAAAPAAGDVAARIQNLKDAAAALGGVEPAKRILDMLK